MSAKKEQSGGQPSSVPVRHLVPIVVWLGLGTLLLVLANLGGSETWTPLAVALVPAGNVVMTLLTIFFLIRKNPRNLYFPLIAYLFATAVYHGFGPLVFSIGSPEEQMYASKFFDVDTGALLGVLLLSQVCQVGVLLGYLGFRVVLGRWMDRTVMRFPPGNGRQLRGLFLVMALWGLCIKFFLQLPVDLYLVEAVPSGTLLLTGYFSYAAHFYFWYEVASGRMKHHLPVILLLVDVAFGVILLAKMFMLLPFIALAAGYHMAHPLKLRTWALLAGGGLLLLVILQPLNAYLRLRRAQGETVSVVALAQDMSGFLDRDSLVELQEMKRAGDIGTSVHSRLAYVDIMAYAIDEWRMGRPGDSYKHFRYTLVPRSLWPGKPLALMGLDVTRRVAGHEFSFTGVTLFGEAYFNLGPLGVILLCLWLPFILVMLEFPARLVMERGRFEQVLPLFFGLLAGLRVDTFALHYVSQSLIALVAIPALYYASRYDRLRKGAL